MKSLKEAFGFKLKELRKSKNYTQEVLAEMLDLSPRQLIRIENGENFPTAETISRISLIFGVELNKLFDFTWNEDMMYFKNGAYNKPSLKVIKQGEKFLIKPIEQIPNRNFFNNKPFKDNEYEFPIFNYCKEINHPVTVEFFENKKRTSIKKFYPNKKIEDVISSDDVRYNELYNKILSQLKNISTDEDKLHFIKLALDALNNKDAAEELSILLKGIILVSKK